MLFVVNGDRFLTSIKSTRTTGITTLSAKCFTKGVSDALSLRAIRVKMPRLRPKRETPRLPQNIMKPPRRLLIQYYPREERLSRLSLDRRAPY